MLTFRIEDVVAEMGGKVKVELNAVLISQVTSYLPLGYNV